MPEELFRFKKFNILQNDRVHKVGTDGVLLGAWANLRNSKRILDIGTGTGLIALMIAQRASREVCVTAIELDSVACGLAKQNFEKSSFSSMIQLIQCRLQDFKSDSLFDAAVCNPPYFVNSLKPPGEYRKRQRHSDDLAFDELLTCVTSLLSPAGRLGMILPIEEGDKFILLAQNFGLNLSRQCSVVSREGKGPERYLLEFCYHLTRTQSESITLMRFDGRWTDEYKSLTQDFYLNF